MNFAKKLYQSLRFVAPAFFLAGASLAAADGPPSYSLKIEATPTKAGATANARVEITPASGYHINKEYPTSLKLEAAAGLDLPKPKLARADMKVADEHQLLIEVPYVAKEKGAHTINGTASFAVCTNDNTSCNPQKVKVTIPVDVK